MQIKSNIEWKKLYLKAKQTAENKFSQKMRNYTFAVVDKYGLEAGKNNRTDHNNQADAFKHAYMQWWIAYRFGNDIAKKTR